MSALRSGLLGIVTVLLWLVPLGDAWGQPFEAWTTRALEAVFQVEANHCPIDDTRPGWSGSGRRYGTGVALRVNEATVFLTARHVILGCTQVKIRRADPKDGQVFSTSVDVVAARCDPGTDLAVLQTKGTDDAVTNKIKPLPLDATSGGDLLELLGFPWGTRGHQAHDQRVAHAATQLQTRIDDKTKRDLGDYGAPSMSTEVVVMSGGISHGMSGGPVYTRSQEPTVAGIAVAGIDGNSTYAISAGSIRLALKRARACATNHTQGIRATSLMSAASLSGTCEFAPFVQSSEDEYENLVSHLGRDQNAANKHARRMVDNESTPGTYSDRYVLYTAGDVHTVVPKSVWYGQRIPHYLLPAECELHYRDGPLEVTISASKTRQDTASIVATKSGKYVLAFDYPNEVEHDGVFFRYVVAWRETRAQRFNPNKDDAARQERLLGQFWRAAWLLHAQARP